MSNSIGKRLKELRDARMSQEEMARLSGVPRTTIQRIESGRSHDYRDIEAIMTVLGLSPAVLWQTPIKEMPLSPSAVDGPLLASDAAILLDRLADSPAAVRKRVVDLLSGSEDSDSEVQELRKLKSEFDRIYGSDGIKWLLSVKDVITPQTILVAAGKPSGSREKQRSSVQPPAEQRVQKVSSKK